jgi:hypothetical protein
MKIATDEQTENLETDRAKSAASDLGSRGAKARAAKLDPEKRRAIARRTSNRKTAGTPIGGFIHLSTVC